MMQKNNLNRETVVINFDNNGDQMFGSDIKDNGISFNKFDAKEMGDIAIKIKNGIPLTAGELAKSRNKMQKYWKQLMFISLEQAKIRKLQEQKESKRKLAKEEADAAKEHEEKLKEFKNNIEVLRRCSEEGISCDFGICDECPVTIGFNEISY